MRPFINAAGTYTAMTASLMPPEVMEAINYASKHYVMLDELHDKVGRADRHPASTPRRAMVTSGAASALTLGPPRCSPARIGRRSSTFPTSPA